MNIKTLMTASLLMLAALATAAQDQQARSVTIDHPYALATAAGQSTGGGFMTLVNRGGNDRLLSMSAQISKSVELHEMKMDGDVMRMRQVDGLVLPAGQTVELKPGSYHVMFMGLKAPLKAGDSFPMKLRFEKAGDVTVSVKIEAPGAMSGMKH